MAASMIAIFGEIESQKSCTKEKTETTVIMDQQEVNVSDPPAVSENVTTDPTESDAPVEQLKPVETDQQEEPEKVEENPGADEVNEQTSAEADPEPETAEKVADPEPVIDEVTAPAPGEDEKPNDVVTDEKVTSSEPVPEEKHAMNQNGTQEGSEEDEDSTEDDTVKAKETEIKAPEPEPVPTPIIDTSASRVKEQKKQSKKESKSKSKSRDAGKTKDKKKEDKSIEHVLKALSSLSSPEEKLAALCKKYTELLEEHKTVQAAHKQSQKQVTVVLREKEQLQMEHSKSLLAKSKMENLCRELQKHNKLIKDESLARVKDEEEKRREVANRFQTTITDIQAQMQDNYTKNTKLREENIELATRLKELVGNYEKAQSQVEKVFNQNLSLTQDKEKDCKEKQLLYLELEQSQKKCELLETTELQLRTQLALYTEKYEDFQSTLQKSNDVFNTFKGEMDKMSKKIKKLEKETVMWKSRCENSNKVCIEMAEEKQRRDQETLKSQTKIQKLEKLCRALQMERNALKSDSDRSSVSRGASPSDATKDTSPAPEGKDEAKPAIETESKTDETKIEPASVDSTSCETSTSNNKPIELEQEQNVEKTEQSAPDQGSADGEVLKEKGESAVTDKNQETSSEAGIGSDSSTSVTATPEVSEDNSVTPSDSATSVATSEDQEDGEGTVSDVD